MVDQELTMELDVTDGFRFGVMAGAYVAAGAEVDDTDVAPCEDCSCGLADDGVETETREFATAPDSFVQRQIRQALEDSGFVSEDDLVKRVEVCPEQVTIEVEDG